MGLEESVEGRRVKDWSRQWSLQEARGGADRISPILIDEETKPW